MALETTEVKGKEGNILTPNKTVTKLHFHMSEGKKETNRKRMHNAIHFLLGFFNSGMQMTNEPCTTISYSIVSNYHWEAFVENSSLGMGD